MKRQPSFITALWFVPLLAVLAAAIFVFFWWIGRMVFASRVPRSVANVSIKQEAPFTNSLRQEVEQVPPIVPYFPTEQEEGTVPQEVAEMTEEIGQQEADAQIDSPETCPALSVPVKINKPKRRVTYTPYERGLIQCKKRGVFPCAWEDQTKGVIKQYWLMGASGDIQRGVYDMGGNLISETIATINGTVTSHTEQNITWYFQGGLLIKIRTSPYDNCNFHDWFFINEMGKQDVCQCAYPTQDCCARSPYQEGMERSYCKLFALDKDFCKG